MSKSKTRIAELREIYRVIAKFYPDSEFQDAKGKGYNARYFADVVRRGHEEDPIDAYLVMINPGSCRPVPDTTELINYSFYKESDIGEAISDPAQKCVMELMEEFKEDKIFLNKIRILNLIDYADGNINNATEEMLKANALSKSIFHPSRKDDLKKYMPTKAPCIIAWGINSKLNPLKEQAMNSLIDYTIVGAKVEGTDPYAYSYIKPYVHDMQGKVRKEIKKDYINKVILSN